jgi:drug/metabolite transporter (DMT)-like permease
MTDLPASSDSATTENRAAAHADGTANGVDWVGYLAAFVACFVLAAQNVVAKLCLAGGLSAEDLVAIRFCLPGLFLLPFFIRRACRADGRQFLKHGALLAIASGVPYGLILTNAYRFSSAAHGAVLVPSATLVGGMMMSRVVLGVSVGRSALTAAAVALIGMFLVSGGKTDAVAAPHPVIGDALFVLCGFFWSCNPVFVQKFRLKPSEVVLSVMVWSLLYVPIYFAQTGLIEALRGGTGPAVWTLVGAVTFYAIIHSSFALPLYAWATRRLSALRMALLTPFIPVSGVLLAVTMLGERLNLREVAGGLLVCFALYLSVRMKAAKQRTV